MTRLAAAAAMAWRSLRRHGGHFSGVWQHLRISAAIIGVSSM